MLPLVAMAGLFATWIVWPYGFWAITHWGDPSGGELVVYNNDQNEQVVVRVHTAEGPVDWLLRPNQIETLLNQDHPIPGPIELLDPTTCEVLARAELPRGPGLFGVTGRGSTPEGVDTGWTLSVDVADPSDQVGIDPNFTACVAR
jgi:hypothetical protein